MQIVALESSYSQLMTTEAPKRERYSCGFILLTKILGALVEKGAMFDDIWKCYKKHYRSYTYCALELFRPRDGAPSTQEY
jgi:hypothetical protein